ncbi:MAG: hypothetical protein QOE08_2075 [Thermoleophilaceae bacterium]|nr:hypothetical protein [Thermoleophilaceae bacterium]
MSTPVQDRRGLALVLIATAQFVVILDASIVNVALPSIGSDLHFSESNLQWVVNAYVLAFGGFLLLGGRMADLLGRKRVFIAGLIVFGLASLVGGLATSEGTLIAARAVQGLGGALLSPAALSIITTTFPEGSERNKALGVWGAVAGAGGAAGVLLGGILTDSLGWQWVLFVNTPITLVAAAVASRLLVESRAESARRHFDAFGAVTITGALTLLVYTLVRTDANGWGSATTIGLLAVSAALLAVFIFWEMRSPAPLVPFRIFRLRSLTVANVVGLLTGAALLSMFFFVSLYMQRVLGYSPLKAGLSYLPLTVMIIVSAGVASQLTTRLGVKPVLVCGMLLVTLGLLLFSGISPTGSFLNDVLPASLVAGAGLGFAFVPITIGSQMGVPSADAGHATGQINTSQQIGGALGLAVLSTIATSRTGHVLAAAHGAQSALPHALTEGFKAAFTAGAGFAFAGVVLALTLLRTSRGEPVTEPVVETA